MSKAVLSQSTLRKASMLELLNSLAQAYERFPKVVTVRLTGQADEAAIESAGQQSNPYAYIRKPWTEEELQSLTSAALTKLIDNQLSDRLG